MTLEVKELVHDLIGRDTFIPGDSNTVNEQIWQSGILAAEVADIVRARDSAPSEHAAVPCSGHLQRRKDPLVGGLSEAVLKRGDVARDAGQIRRVVVVPDDHEPSGLFRLRRRMRDEGLVVDGIALALGISERREGLVQRRLLLLAPGRKCRQEPCTSWGVFCVEQLL